MKTKIVWLLVIISIVIIAVIFIFAPKEEELKTIAPSPIEVVGFYLYSTLGSLEEVMVNYDKARQYLSPELRQEFTGSEFVPMSYCIQDGPDEVEIHEEQLVADSINVKVSALYDGELIEMWEFILTPDKENPNNNWLIKEIVCLNY
jgi:hypothetical protein